ncbi:MAG: hypothetical protein WAN74_07870 [Thermoplasmata archaeon]
MAPPSHEVTAVGAIPGQTDSVRASTASAVVVGSATSNANPLVAGDTVVLGVTVSGYPGASCGAETLFWTLTGQTVQTVNSQGFASGVSPNGTYSYAWTAQAGNWNYTISMISASCSAASSGPFDLIVEGTSGGGGISGIPGWIYSFLQVTWGGVQTAVDQGITQPISAVITAIGSSIAGLEAPWGNYLASWGVLGPAAVVIGFGATAASCFGILGFVGIAKVSMGD